MAHCATCGRDVCTPCIPVLVNENRRQVFAPRDAEIADPDNVQTLARISSGHGLARRPYLDFLAETIYWFDGDIFWSDKREFIVADTLIDDAFPDADGRCISDIWKFAERRPRQRAQSRVLNRLRLMWIAEMIADPQVERQIRRWWRHR